jgi:hypothetical protein
MSKRTTPSISNPFEANSFEEGIFENVSTIIDLQIAHGYISSFFIPKKNGKSTKRARETNKNKGNRRKTDKVRQKANKATLLNLMQFFKEKGQPIQEVAIRDALQQCSTNPDMRIGCMKASLLSGMDIPQKTINTLLRHSKEQNTSSTLPVTTLKQIKEKTAEKLFYLYNITGKSKPKIIELSHTCDEKIKEIDKDIYTTLLNSTESSDYLAELDKSSVRKILARLFTNAPVPGESSEEKEDAVLDVASGKEPTGASPCEIPEPLPHTEEGADCVDESDESPEKENTLMPGNKELEHASTNKLYESSEEKEDVVSDDASGKEPTPRVSLPEALLRVLYGKEYLDYVEKADEESEAENTFTRKNREQSHSSTSATSMREVGIFNRSGRERRNHLPTSSKNAETNATNSPAL